MPKPSRALLALAVMALLAGCGGSAADATETPEPPAFDLAAVQASFTAECQSPIVVDELFCEQVQIEQMRAEGNILNVPTTLNPAADDRGRAICEQLQVAHFDGEGNDLGYEFIGIEDRNGGNLAACGV